MVVVPPRSTFVNPVTAGGVWGVGNKMRRTACQTVKTDFKGDF